MRPALFYTEREKTGLAECAAITRFGKGHAPDKVFEQVGRSSGMKTRSSSHSGGLPCHRVGGGFTQR